MADDALELLSLNVMDVRTTVESMRRSVTSAQSSIEQYRHTQGKDRLLDIQDCLAELVQEGVALEESVAHATKYLEELIAPPAPSPDKIET
jgi:hypothetical protein